MVWMKQAGVMLAITACFAAAVLVAGCGEVKNDHPLFPTQQSGSIGDSSVVIPDPTKWDMREPIAAGYPNYCFVLDVPWMSQMPPKRAGDKDELAWKLTNNCGQAVCVMLGGHFNNGAVAPWVIDAENSMLGCALPYGCTTGYTQLERLLREFHGLQSAYYTGNKPDDVVMEGTRGRPVIVGVRTRMQETGGRPHWMLFVGYDGPYMYFHDPGRQQVKDGRFVRYTVDQFYKSWTNQGKKYIPVWK